MKWSLGNKWNKSACRISFNSMKNVGGEAIEMNKMLWIFNALNTLGCTYTNFCVWTVSLLKELMMDRGSPCFFNHLLHYLPSIMPFPWVMGTIFPWQFWKGRINLLKEFRPTCCWLTSPPLLRECVVAAFSLLCPQQGESFVTFSYSSQQLPLPSMAEIERHIPELFKRRGRWTSICSTVVRAFL